MACRNFDVEPLGSLYIYSLLLPSDTCIVLYSQRSWVSPLWFSAVQLIYTCMSSIAVQSHSTRMYPVLSIVMLIAMHSKKGITETQYNSQLFSSYASDDEYHCPSYDPNRNRYDHYNISSHSGSLGQFLPATTVRLASIVDGAIE